MREIAHDTVTIKLFSFPDLDFFLLFLNQDYSQGMMALGYYLAPAQLVESGLPIIPQPSSLINSVSFLSVSFLGKNPVIGDGNHDLVSFLNGKI